MIMNRFILVILVCAMAAIAPGYAHAFQDRDRKSTDQCPDGAPYSVNRAEEDYSCLRDPSLRTDFWDPLKYIPFNAAGTRYLSLGGEARERYEYFSHPRLGTTTSGSGYYLQRYAVHADLHMGDNLRLFNQLQSSLERNREGGPRPIDRDELDLHQSFLDIRIDLGGSSSLVLRSGRQELSYGSQRLISVKDGTNVRQSFDGIRAIFRRGDFRADAFVAEPVETNRHAFDDGTDNGRGLWGLYTVSQLPPAAGGNLDLYYIGFYSGQSRFDQGNGREIRQSAGTRLWRRAKPLDYNFEFTYQWGKFGHSNISAWTAASNTGYTFGSLPLSPRLGLSANVTSGDRDPGKPDLQTFNPLFPRGSYFSENGLIGPSNHIDLNPSIGLNLTDRMNLSLNWDFFWRESTHDGVYDNARNLVRSGKKNRARYVGNQPQAVIEWEIDRHISFTGIYAHFFPGTFLNETGPSRDIDYTTAWVTYKF